MGKSIKDKIIELFQADDSGNADNDTPITKAQFKAELDLIKKELGKSITDTIKQSLKEINTTSSTKNPEETNPPKPEETNPPKPEETNPPKPNGTNNKDDENQTKEIIKKLQEEIQNLKNQTAGKPGDTTDNITFQAEEYMV
ncbi:MAG: hypothetical protein ACRCW6_03480 [Mycoplasmoidaceae bacterium]